MKNKSYTNEISLTYYTGLDVLFDYINRLEEEIEKLGKTVTTDLTDDEMNILDKCNKDIKLYSKAFAILASKNIDTHGVRELRYVKDYNTIYANGFNNYLTDEEWNILKEINL